MIARAIQARLLTTNGVERLNEEIRKRERLIRIVPRRTSAMSLLGTLLMESMRRGQAVTVIRRWTITGSGDGPRPRSLGNRPKK
ncbi:transposase [Alicyclobacillus fastidiosus]|uniref:transposase n=1 Tax=Alicyclobacillus fastidiosus TaxID=392011 RepID=UPI003530500C